MMDANFVCLECAACYHRNRHYCTDLCHPQGKKVFHFDWCHRCVRLMMASFERQFSKEKKK